jgi:hypothetical protein
MSILRENPVLWKDLRNRARSRRRARVNRITVVVVIGLSILALYWFGLRGILAANSARLARDLYMLFVLGIETTLLLFLVPSLAAGSITQEREQQTWNALLLSRLRPAEIVLGKYVAAVLPPLLILALFAPLNLTAAIIANIAPIDILLTGLHLLATLFFYAAVGVFCSWACRRTFIANAAAFAVTGFFVVGTFILYVLAEEMFRGGRTYLVVEEFLPLWLNPYMPVTLLMDRSSRMVTPSLVYIVFCFTGAFLLLLIAMRRLTKGPKELEQ